MDTRRNFVPRSPTGIPTDFEKAAQIKHEVVSFDGNGTSPSPGTTGRIRSPGWTGPTHKRTGAFQRTASTDSLYRPYADSVPETLQATSQAKDEQEKRRNQEKLWKLMSTYLKRDVPTIQRHICNHVEYTLARTRYNFDDYAAYQATALSVRDRLIESWNDTQQYFTLKDVKRVYYLSLEFLMGRSLQNAIMNLGLRDQYAEALKEMGHRLEDIIEQEKDAALGNGGLGRLAACFMDSLATMDYPAWGYGLRYTYGMFQQQIIDGEQAEFPDYWLTFGNPWEIERLDVLYPVQFYGKVYQFTDRRGVTRHRWEAGDVVFAIAYDTPIPGYDTFNTINIRLWSSKPAREFDLSSFNSGDYYRAIEARQRSEQITAVLYPNDNTLAGKELRLKQQYFFCSATLKDCIRRFKKTGKPLTKLADQVAIQLNDTHPSISIPELMRLLVDEEGLLWDEAWTVCTEVFSFTNHTVLPEALEKWSVKLMENLLPRHLQIIYDINWNFLQSVRARFAGESEQALNARLGRMSIIEEGDEKRIRMANLAIVGSHTINGVAAIHTAILKESIFRDFYEMWPQKFQNKTNGVTPRRWIAQCNPELSNIISTWTEQKEEEWLTDLSRIRGLDAHSTNKMLHKQMIQMRQKNKKRLADYVAKVLGISIPTDAMYVVQIKRIHEYKRQFLNILGVIERYDRLRAMTEAERKKQVPRVQIFGGKAAPGYYLAKRVIKLINSVADVVNKDPLVNNYLKVVFIPNYNVSLAEIIIPATDISEHISTAGTEASGTSNMKFAMNGSLILGTLDGANVEIKEEIGDDNIFIFGAKKEEVDAARAQLRSGNFKLDARLQRVIELMRSGIFGNPQGFEALFNVLNPANDYYLHTYDFPAYLAAQDAVDETWRTPDRWWKMVIESVARMAKFSSDRTIAEYAEDIWHVKPCPRPAPEPANADAGADADADSKLLRG
eukprot:GEZU01003423.1.p1 GENE.GEZU01003423.1~~GEZU01003423.1.p1  ORF type:complete len:952 (+),score=347.78 GEZU01003423.1:92-2947(+)